MKKNTYKKNTNEKKLIKKNLIYMKKKLIYI